MGADLYINGFDKYRAKSEPLFNVAVEERNKLQRGTPEYQEAQRKVEEAYDTVYSSEWYFRDSYNDTSVFWKLGLSWWKDLEPFYLPEEEQNDNVNIGPEGCRKLVELIEKQTLDLPTDMEVKDAGWEEDPEQVRAYFVDKHKRLIRFLKTAANEGGMFASV